MSQKHQHGAGFLYYFKNTSLSSHMSKILSATMLDLCLKGYLTFETVEGKKDQIKVILKQIEDINLPEDEKTIFSLFQQIANKQTNSFTMKEFENYARNHPSIVLGKINKIEEQAKNLQQEKGNYDKKQIETYQKWILKGVGYLFLGIFSIVFMQILVIPAIVASIYSFKLSGRYNQLTKKRSR